MAKGNGNYNTWGGKNNSWGNKNRKGKSGGGGGPVRDDEAWSKGAKVVAGGVVLLVLANTGLGPIVETAENVMEVFDFGNDIKEAKAASKANNKNSGKAKSAEDSYKSVKNNVDLEASDVKDILEFFEGEFRTTGIDASDVKVNIIDYDAFKNDRKYNKNIVDKLSKRSGTVTFMAVCPDYLTEDEMRTEFERIGELVSNNKDGVPAGVFRSIKRNGGLNVPGPGSFTMAVTFVAY